MLLNEYAIEWWFYIPPLLTNVSALPGDEPRKLGLFSHTVPGKRHCVSLLYLRLSVPILIILAGNRCEVCVIISLFNFSCSFAITPLSCCEFTKAKITHFWHHRLFVNMPITKKDKTLIKNLFTLEYNNAKKASWQRWNVGNVYKLLQKLRVTGLVSHCLGSGGRCSARTANTIDLVCELVLHKNG